MKKIIGLAKDEVILMDYNPLWKNEYEKEEKLLKKYLKDFNVIIEHIGSTAIVGIKAKPIIDIMIAVDKLEEARQFIPIFDKLEEYDFRDDNGEKGEYLLRKGPEDCRTHYIHIVEKNGMRYKESVYFRDYMNTHPGEAKKYEEIKVNIASTNEIDRKEYTKTKRDFISNIMNKAIELYENKNVVYSYEELLELGSKYDIPIKDMLLMYGNFIGVNIKKISTPRVRFKLQLNDSSKIFNLGAPNNYRSSFYEKDNILYFNEIEIGKIIEMENDDCSSSYFRNNNTSLTLNSNLRSKCFGCKFCPNILELNNEYVSLNDREILSKHLKDVLLDAKYEDMSKIDYITVCTGCFVSSSELINHLSLVKEVSTELGFKGVIHYIGSQLISEEELSKIKQKIGNIMISFTIECVNNREILLKKTKSRITLSDYKKSMEYCNSIGITTNYIFIIGLDPLKDIIEFIKEFKDVVKHFPTLNIYQAHSEKDMELLNIEAYDLEYYCKIRKEVEKIYSDTTYIPSSWECYRPLWYTRFNDKDM